MEKRRDVFHYLKIKKYSICFLQDIHIAPKLTKYVEAEWGYKAFFCPFTSQARGVAILFSNSFEFKIKEVSKSDDGNSIFVTIEMFNQKFLLVNLYGPNRDSPEFYNGIKDYIANPDFQNVIIAGDFNLILDPSKDCENYRNVNNPRAREVVQDMIDSQDLCDIWRELNLDIHRFSWRRNNPFQQARLDYFLISDYVTSYVEDADIVSGYRSDHSMVTLTLKFSKDKIKRNTFWKMNSSLLKDKDYLSEVNNVINEIIIEYSTNIDSQEMLAETPIQRVLLTVSDEIFLDFLLMKIRSKTIAYATMKKRTAHREEEDLKEEIERLEKLVLNQENNIELSNKRDQLQTIRDKRMQGVLLRSRARWLADGEKISKYFCNLEKRHFINKNMTKLIDKNGLSLTGTSDISNEVKSFYENLYKPKDVIDCEIDELVSNLPTLTEEEGTKLEGELV